MRRILDKTFRYTPSFNTDLRKSFRKYAQQEKERAEREAANTAEVTAKVEKFPTRRSA